MFGIFDELFDVDNDGSLDAMEQGAEFSFIDEIMKDDIKERLEDCIDEEEIREVLEDEGLDPDDFFD